MAIESRYDVLSVCRHVVNYCNEKGIYIDNLKLQKLLYFIQANFLYETKGAQACFNENIVAWRYGPVVVEAYENFKMYGSSIIPPVEYFTEMDPDSWTFKKVRFVDQIKKNEDDAELIDDMIDQLGGYSSTQLVEITHRQDPWLNAFAQGMHTVIEKEALFNFFKD